MTINYNDGGKLVCTVIDICDGVVIADQMYIIPIDDIADITDE